MRGIQNHTSCRIAQLSETLRQERELRAGDLSAFDAQIDQFREEKEMALRDLEDLRNTHKGTLQRLEAVEERSEKLSGGNAILHEKIVRCYYAGAIGTNFEK